MYDPLLKEKVAKLLDVKADTLSISTVETGLTHLTYKCTGSANTYFVKQYQPSSDLQIKEINLLTKLMRSRGIPAPKVAAYSNEFPKLVIHEYVDGSHPAGKPIELVAIAQLYSQLTTIGLEKPIQVDRSRYLQQIKEVKFRFSQLDNEKVVCKALHQQYLAILNQVVELLDQLLKGMTITHIPTHDDFTENNLLIRNDKVALLCDWDSYRLKGLSEHLSCAVMRFSTLDGFSGNVDQSKLLHFYLNLEKQVLSSVDEPNNFPQQLPVFATLKHLRTYGLRNHIVKNQRPDLETSLLRQPLEHCQWLLENRQRISQWVVACH